MISKIPELTNIGKFIKILGILWLLENYTGFLDRIFLIKLLNYKTLLSLYLVQVLKKVTKKLVQHWPLLIVRLNSIFILLLNSEKGIIVIVAY